MNKHQFHFTLTETDYKKLQMLAERNGETMVAIVRQLIRKEADYWEGHDYRVELQRKREARPDYEG